jgi:hypothetical protein
MSELTNYYFLFLILLFQWYLILFYLIHSRLPAKMVANAIAATTVDPATNGEALQATVASIPTSKARKKKFVGFTHVSDCFT